MHRRNQRVEEIGSKMIEINENNVYAILLWGMTNKMRIVVERHKSEVIEYKTEDSSMRLNRFVSFENLWALKLCIVK